MKQARSSFFITIFTIIIALLTESIAINLEDSVSTAIRAAKSYDQNSYGSNDYDTDYYPGKSIKRKKDFRYYYE